MVVAEGEGPDLERFCRAICRKDPRIKVEVDADAAICAEGGLG